MQSSFVLGSLLQGQGSKFASLICALTLLTILLLTPTLRTSELLITQNAAYQRYADVRSMLQHCSHVYVDCGTNVGVQIRKLYEPKLFPKAKIAPHFDEYFGSENDRRQQVCSFGFEPNASHSAHLQMLERAYNDMGWRTRIFVETAIGPKPTTMYLRPDPDVANMQWRASMVDTGAGDPIPVVGIVDFFRNALVWDDESEHVIVMKVDIEGMDTAALAELAFSGQLCRVSFVYIEHVKKSTVEELNFLLKEAGCDTVVSQLDDETYYKGIGVPLPSPPTAPQ
jgi:hypothetical protein